MTRITHVEPGLYANMSNHDYHRAPGISKSALDLIAVSPSYYKWALDAPIDEEKTAAYDVGSALHCWLLEQDRFFDCYASEYKDPDSALVTVDNIKDYLDKIGAQYAKSWSKGKLEETLLELDPNAPLSSALRKQWDEGNKGKTIIPAEDWRKLQIMRESVFAHPTARMIFEADGRNESSIFWIDPETGEQCKCRPDRYIWLDDQPVIIDVKKTADFDKFQWKVRDYRYHVQSAMYSEGFERHFGVKPWFWFLRVSSTVELGRYPVSVDDLSDEYMFDQDTQYGTMLGAYSLFRRDLQTYHECKKLNDWVHVPTITTRKY